MSVPTVHDLKRETAWQVDNIQSHEKELQGGQGGRWRMKAEDMQGGQGEGGAFGSGGQEDLSEEVLFKPTDEKPALPTPLKEQSRLGNIMYRSPSQGRPGTFQNLMEDVPGTR